MAQQLINIGLLPGDGSGDPIRVSFNKTNQNFIELYAALYTSNASTQAQIDRITAIFDSKASVANVYSKLEIDQMLLNITNNNDWGYLIPDNYIDFGLIINTATSIEDFGSIL